MIVETKVPVVNLKAGKSMTLRLDTDADRVTIEMPASLRTPVVERGQLERALAELNQAAAPS